jgi:hypothetical protein
MKRLDRQYLRFHRMTIRGLGCRVGRFRGSLESQPHLSQFANVLTCDRKDIERGNAGHEE